MREAQLVWLREVELRTRKTATEIARGAGLDPSTLTGFKTGRRSRLLESLTITAISNAWDIPVNVEVRGGPAPRALSEETMPFVFDGDGALDSAIRALVAGRNGVYPLTLQTTSIELAGYLFGDVVLVDQNAAPQPGDAVIAQVYDWPKMTAKTIVRVFERAAPVDLLVAKSHDAALKPMVADGEKVIVKGVLQPHRLRRAA